jgi:hypothetical protein
VDERAGQELERFDELSIVDIVSCFGLIDEQPGSLARNEVETG